MAKTFAVYADWKKDTKDINGRPLTGTVTTWYGTKKFCAEQLKKTLEGAYDNGHTTPMLENFRLGVDGDPSQYRR